jgi:peptidoglycan/LPS O-acetylase OafA/YrhL
LRNERIDILRGVAICGVLILHFTLGYGLKDSPLGALLPAWLLKGIALNGNYGVTMFFAVSGFLITQISLRRWGQLSAIDLRSFYVYRAARILPPLLPVLAIIVVLGSLGLPHFANSDGGHHLPASTFVVAVGSVLTFWHNVLMQKLGYFNYCLNVYWSLSVEEAFYLAMPLLCRSLRRPALLLGVCLALVAGGPWYRSTHSGDEILYLYAYPACFDAIALGCLAAYAAHHRPASGLAATVCRIGGAAMAATIYLMGIGGHVTWGFTGIALATAACLYGSAHAPAPGRWLSALTRPLRWMGRRSYEIYLLHIVVLAAMLDALPRSAITPATRLPWMALFVALACIVAAGMARWIAEPANGALRHRWLARERARSARGTPGSAAAVAPE